MRCATRDSDIDLWGNYDAAATQNLVIAFETCDSKTSSVPCKSKTEIKDWMLEKYIVVMKNEKKFITHKFDDSEKIDKSASLTWYAVNSETRTDYVNMIYRMNFETNDSLLNLGQMTMEFDDGFRIERRPNRELPYRNNFQNAVTFEMSFK